MGTDYASKPQEDLHIWPSGESMQSEDVTNNSSSRATFRCRSDIPRCYIGYLWSLIGAKHPSTSSNLKSNTSSVFDMYAYKSSVYSASSSWTRLVAYKFILVVMSGHRNLPKKDSLILSFLLSFSASFLSFKPDLSRWPISMLNMFSQSSP